MTTVPPAGPAAAAMLALGDALDQAVLFTCLPDGVLQTILAFLTPQELLTVSLVNRRCALIAHSQVRAGAALPPLFPHPQTP